MKNFFLLIIITLLFPLSFLINFQSIYYSINNQYLKETNYEEFTPTTTPVPIIINEQPSILEVRIDSLENLIELQSQSYSATVSRWESNLNLILSIIGIASILIAIFGITAFKYWVKSQI